MFGWAGANSDGVGARKAQRRCQVWKRLGQLRVQAYRVLLKGYREGAETIEVRDGSLIFIIRYRLVEVCVQLALLSM